MPPTALIAESCLPGNGDSVNGASASSAYAAETQEMPLPNVRGRRFAAGRGELFGRRPSHEE